MRWLKCYSNHTFLTLSSKHYCVCRSSYLWMLFVQASLTEEVCMPRCKSKHCSLKVMFAELGSKQLSASFFVLMHPLQAHAVSHIILSLCISIKNTSNLFVGYFLLNMTYTKALQSQVFDRFIVPSKKFMNTREYFLADLYTEKLMSEGLSTK